MNVVRAYQFISVLSLNSVKKLLTLPMPELQNIWALRAILFRVHLHVRALLNEHEERSSFEKLSRVLAD